MDRSHRGGPLELPTTSTAKAMTTAPKRRWIQFSLRESFLLIAVVACASGWVRERLIHSGQWWDDLRTVQEVLDRMDKEHSSEIQLQYQTGGGGPDQEWVIVRRIPKPKKDQPATH
jgi:hypothetical protein